MKRREKWREAIMGKNKRKHLSSGPKGNKQKFTGKGAKPTGITKSQPPQKKKKHVQEAHKRPTIPISPLDRILLIGEGDLSFARSLIEHHKCVSLTATTLESRDELLDKYPTAAENIEKVEEGGGKLRHGVDAMKAVGGVWKELRGKMDRVVFNFPHVGGKTKDVNRQVRYNQGWSPSSPSLPHPNLNLLPSPFNLTNEQC
jgi:25S rRNA (uracil2634-N3)-methyltransferase